MKTKVLLSLLFSVFAAFFIAGAVAPILEVPVVPTAGIIIGGGVVVGFVVPNYMPHGAAFMAVQNEIWVKYIIDRLFKENPHLQLAFNEDQYVVGGRVVHIPQPGAKPTVVKNRSSFPAAAVRRADTDITYVLDEYTTDPTHIQDAEKVELSYSKIDSVFGDHAGVVLETVGDDMLIKWAAGIPTSKVLSTTGGDAAAVIAGQTGTRKVLIDADLQKIKLKMNLENVPVTDRYALLEDNMADQLFTSLSQSQYKDFSAFADPINGVVGKLHGFNIMRRSSVLMVTSANAVNPLGAAVAATDGQASLFWQKNSVTKALGERKFFEKKDDPQFYGDVYSALLRMGGRRRREDDAGVWVLKAGA